MIKFFKEKFFFLIDKNEKRFIRNRCRSHDHSIFNILLGCIMTLQVIMLLMSFARGDTGDKANLIIAYRVAYIFLFSICLISLLVLDRLNKKENPFPYYIMVGIAMVSFMVWGAAISILDSISHGYVDILYFAIALIATSVFVCLEPWVSAIDVLVVGAAFAATFIILWNQGMIVENPEYPVPSVGFFIAIPTIVGIAIAGSWFNFMRRISAVRLEMEVSKLNSVLEDKAYIDELTKVYNRRYLTENIDAPLTYGVNCSSVMMIDLDHFKQINDNYGHQVGDKCLEKIGTELNNIIKGKDSYCVRYGGEEFLIYFRSIKKEELIALAEELRRRVENNLIVVPGGNNFSYTVSIGLAAASKKISYNKLINRADSALYKAKETRNAVSFFEE